MFLQSPDSAAPRRPSHRRARRRAQRSSHRIDQQSGSADELSLIESILRERATGHADGVGLALAAARTAASPLLDGPRPELAPRHFLACSLVRLAVETDCDIPALAPALGVFADEFGYDTLDVGMHVLADPLLLDLPLKGSTDAVIALVRLLAPVQNVSLWLREPDRAPDRLQPGWETAPERRSAVARREMMLEAAAEATGLRKAPISCWHRPCAALVFLPEPGRDAECQALAERGAALLGPAFERASLIEGNVARSEALLSAGERLLTRLGFDIHDGPLQDVAVLTGELDTIRRHVGNTLGATALGNDLTAKLDDAAAVANFLDGELRDLAVSIDGTGLTRTGFDQIIAGVLRKFRARCTTDIEIDVLGETDTLTESQKITLIRVVQEALSNIRDHSQASTVRISIDARGADVQASIVDDGCGFDVEEGMVRAGRAGRMGLAGMIERVRLLGGVCEITSQVGTGTEISLTIARWEPSAATAEPEAPVAAPAVPRAA